MKGFHCCLLPILALVGSLENLNLVCSAADPTDGFTPVPLTEANFELLKPCNKLLNDEDGRSYTVQLRPEDASTLILRVYDGNLRYYSGDLVATGLDDRWFRLNIIHDVDGDWATVDVDGEQKYSTKDRGPGDLHFKCGVYAAPRDITYYMESRWRDIKIYKK
uniref:Uncharacterized protein n=1 Tax=Populus alba TaxID=43335 RepID=A0A4U5R711_POPAL|nr:hypothetical protein D5086_0000003860 [Populus alba]